MIKRLAMICLLPLVCAPAFAGPAQDRAPPSRAGELRLYQGANYSGPEFVIDEARSSVLAGGVIRSMSIHPGERWQVCENPRFRAPCVVIDGSVPDTAVPGKDLQVRSARPLRHGD